MGTDTVCYIKQHYDYYTIPPTPLKYHYKNHTDTFCVTHLDSLMQTLNPVDTNLVYYYKSSLTTDHTLCDCLVYRIYTNPSSSEPKIIEVKYGKGLGQVFYCFSYSYPMLPVLRRWAMIYYKKGPYDCGTPDLTTHSIAEYPEQPDVVTISPNPATDRIQLLYSGGDQTSGWEMWLYDIRGNRCMQLQQPVGSGSRQ